MSRHDDRIMRLAREYSATQDTEGMRHLWEALAAAVPPARQRFVIEVVAMMVPNSELASVTKLMTALDEGGAA